ncbi:MAG: hypothetical protein ACRD50_15650 [Candidatus Acidiferrales bacterium]
MRTYVRMLIVIILVAGLMDMPVLGSAVNALGTVVQSENAKLDNVSATSGTTVYAGDSLAAGADGSVRLRFSGSQLFLMGGGAATLDGSATNVSATLTQGAAAFTTTGAGIEVRTPHAVVHAKNADATQARVMLVSEDEIVVSSFRGTVAVEADGQTYTIEAGKSYRVVSELEPDPRGVQRSGVRKRRTLLKLILLGGAAGFGAWGIQEAFESPIAPSKK